MLISAPVLSSVVTAGAESVESLQAQLDELERKNSEYQATLDKTESDIASKEEYSQALVNKITTLNEKINVTRKTMTELTQRISENQKLIDRSNEEIEDQVDALCDRLRVIYMAGSASDLEIVLGAKDFSDFIDKMNLVKTLSGYDKELIADVKQKVEMINKQMDQLQKDREDLQAKEESLNKDLEEFNKLLEENEEVLRNLYSTSDATKAKMSSANSKHAQIEAEIAEYFAEQDRQRKAAEEAARRAEEEKKKRQQQSSSTSKPVESSNDDNSDDEDQDQSSSDDTPSNGGSGSNYYDYDPGFTSGYIWPCPGFYYLSSQFYEDRTSYYHGGIDIAGGGIFGAPVVAAASGTVLYTCSYCVHNWGKSGNCGCGGGYGNYVWLDHGNGKETIYAHLTSLTVSEGQHVSQGDVIGYVGSTGHSTGPHLHFECRYDGVKYDPMSEY